MGLLPVVLAILMLQGPTGAVSAPVETPSEQLDERSQQAPAEPQADQAQSKPRPSGSQQQQANQQKTTPQQPASPAASGSAADDIFSIDRLRQDLERKPTITFSGPATNEPTFKVEIQGKRWELPNLQTRMANAIPRMPVQVPFGGTNAADMARLNTPPEFFGSAPFTNGDLLKMEALSGAYGLAGALIKRAIDARQSAEAAQIREQIRQELVAIDEHNARVAAGQSDDDSGSTKKVDKSKKKPDKKAQKKKEDK